MASDEEHVDELFFAVKKRKWEEVVRILQDFPDIRASRINRNSDTALHAAITNGAPGSIVGEMVDIIEDTHTHTLLAENNNNGDTPLHRAATRGSVYICQRIVRADISLVERRNSEGETPLFLAAFNGQKDVFFYLHNVCKDMVLSSDLWRRNDGNTILHCTIHRMFFDLSFQIIHHIEATAASYNLEGKTPLHILASTPSAFKKSATRLKWWEKLCYPFIPVEELKIEPGGEYKILDVDLPDTDQIHAPVKFLGSVRRKKERYVWGRQIMEELIGKDSWYDYKQGQSELLDMKRSSDIEKLNHTSSSDHSQNNPKEEPILSAIKYGVAEMVKISKGKPDKDLVELKKLVDDDIDMLMQSKNNRTEEEPSTPLLTAVKYGLVELVDKILEKWPEAIYDTNDADHKNIVLVAVEERQSRILEQLMNKHHLWDDDLKYAADIHGNNALHLAAKFSDRTTWEIPMSAMHMQWEIMWFEWVKDIMSQPHPHFTYARNYKEMETPAMIFTAEHRELAEESKQWLKDSSGSYIVASTIVTSVTFGTSYQFLGGPETKGRPELMGNLTFDTFIMAILVAFSFSITALMAFLFVYGSQKQPQNYSRLIPVTFLLGLCSMFVSMFATLVSFYTAHSLNVDRRKYHVVLPLYAFTLLPAFFYIVTQFRIFKDVFTAIHSKVPHSARISEHNDAPS